MITENKDQLDATLQELIIYMHLIFLIKYLYLVKLTIALAPMRMRVCKLECWEWLAYEFDSVTAICDVG